MEDNALEVKTGMLESKGDSAYELYKMPLKHKLFKLEGRMGRLNYFFLGLLLAFFLHACVVPFFFINIPNIDVMNIDITSINVTNIDQTVIFLILAMVFAIIFALFILWSFFCISAKRLHDLNHSSLLFLFILIPVIGMLLPLYMLFWPGKKEANLYGKATDMLSRKK